MTRIWWMNELINWKVLNFLNYAWQDTLRVNSTILLLYANNKISIKHGCIRNGYFPPKIDLSCYFATMANSTILLFSWVIIIDLSIMGHWQWPMLSNTICKVVEAQKFSKSFKKWHLVKDRNKYCTCCSWPTLLGTKRGSSSCRSFVFYIHSLPPQHSVNRKLETKSCNNSEKKHFCATKPYFFHTILWLTPTLFPLNTQSIGN